MKDLINEVEGFFKSVSADSELWPVVEAGMRGEYNQEVNVILFGTTSDCFLEFSLYFFWQASGI